MCAMQGIGLAIGDELAVATGVGDAHDEGWTVLEPAVVCGSSMAAELAVLLAGKEAVAAGFEPLLQSPRRRGYAGSDPELMSELLIALLTTLRQDRPTAAVGLGSPVLAVPHTTAATAVNGLIEAARRAGWGEVLVVSELLALAADQATRSAPGEPVSVQTFDRGWLHRATWSVLEEGGLSGYQLETLTSRFVGGESGMAPPAEGVLARGAALLSAAGGRVGRIGPGVELVLGLAANGGQMLSLGAVREGTRLVRAFHPPPAEGALVRLVAGVQSDLAACQMVAEAWAEPDAAVMTRDPWLLTISMAAGLRGEMILASPGERPPVCIPFQIRLP